MAPRDGYVKVPPPSPSPERRRRRRGSSRSGSEGRSRRRRRDASGSRRRRRRRSSSSSVSSSSPQQRPVAESRTFAPFDPRDQAPEDNRKAFIPPPTSSLAANTRAPLVRGSLRLVGVNFAKYQAFNSDSERQRAFTAAVRDDLISEAGNGVVREDILLRLTPGPIHNVVLDYNAPPKKDGQPGLPSLVDAEWCIDVEYAIAARDEDRQVGIARTLVESLSSQDFRLESTRKAYIRYLNPEHGNPDTIRVVPTGGGEGDQERKQQGHHRTGLYEEDDPLEGRFTWHARRVGHDLARVRALSSPRSPQHSLSPGPRDVPSIGGVPLPLRPVPDPAVAVLNRHPTGTRQPWWDTRPSWETQRQASQTRHG